MSVNNSCTLVTWTGVRVTVKIHHRNCRLIGCPVRRVALENGSTPLKNLYRGFKLVTADSIFRKWTIAFIYANLRVLLDGATIGVRHQRGQKSVKFRHSYAET